MKLGSREADLVLMALLVVYCTGSLSQLWDRPILLFLILLPLPFLLGWRWNSPREALVMGLTGAALGPFTEACCVQGGLWTYADTGPLLWVPPWIFPAWACFTLALGLIARSVDLDMRGRPPRPLVFYLGGVGMEIALFVCLGQSPSLILVAGSLLAVFILLYSPGGTTAVMMLSGAILGPICEALPIAAGAWHYAAPPEILGLPAYMVLAYATFAALVGNVCRAILAWNGNDLR